MQSIFATALVSDRVIYALSWTLLHSLWQGITLAILAGMLMWLGRKQGAALRYNLLSLSLLGFVGAVLLTFVLEWQFQAAYQGGKEVDIHYLTPDLGAFIPAADSNLSEAKSWLQDYWQQWQVFFNQNTFLIVAGWILTLSLKSIKMGLDIWSLYRMRWYRTYQPSLYWRNRLLDLADKIKLKQSVVLLESALVPGPSALGFFKPLILVPVGLLNNLPAEQVEAILLHELAHIRRNDYVVNFMQCLLENVFFFNPGLLWVSNLIRQERENCCDDLAIQAMKNKTLYVNALVAFQEYKLHGAQYALAFAGQKSPLLDRVKRIINHHNYKTLSIMEKVSLLATVLLISAVTFLSLQSTQAQTTKEGRIPSFTNINVSGNGTANNPQIMFLQDVDGKTYSIKRVDKKIQEMYVNGEKLTEDKYVQYEPVIKEIDEQIERDRQQAERDRAQAELDRQQAERDRAQAVLDRQQADRDRVQAERDKAQAELDRQQAGRDREQQIRDQERAKLDRVQADRDKEQAERDRKQSDLDRIQAERDRVQSLRDQEQAKRDRAQAELDRQQADRDRVQAEKDRAQAVLDRQQAERDRAQAEKDRIQAEKDRKEAEELMKSIIEEMITDKLVKDKESLNGFRLTEDAFVVNGVKQSDALHTKYLQKFIKRQGYGIYYGSDSRGGGRGYFFGKQD